MEWSGRERKVKRDARILENNFQDAGIDQ